MTTDERLDVVVQILGDVTRAIGGLNTLDTGRGEDIDELREEVAALGARVDAVMRLVSDPGTCEHGVSFAPGRAIAGRSDWCGECYPDEAPRPDLSYHIPR